MSAEQEETQAHLRRGVIVELLRNIARRGDVGREARHQIVRVANLLAATPGVDGTCRTCGTNLPTQYAGRPREYCGDRCAWVYRQRMSRKASRKAVNE